MPLPTPNKNESEKEFVARFMQWADTDKKWNLKDKKDREQALAVAYSQYKRSLKENKILTFAEILKGLF